jgi:hypothetical protein
LRSNPFCLTNITYFYGVTTVEECRFLARVDPSQLFFAYLVDIIGSFIYFICFRGITELNLLYYY